MIHIYQGNSSQLKANRTMQTLLLGLPESMHKRALRYKQEEDGYNFVLGRLLLKEGLKAYGIEDEFERLRFLEDGKPYLDSVFFNISHSDNLVVCAFSKEGEIGIDIEKEREVDLKGFESFFTEREWKDIFIAEHPLQKFYWYWTRKESIIKALGVNLSYLHKIEVDAKKEWFLENGKKWFLKTINPGMDYTGAICSAVEMDFELKEIVF